MGLVTIGQIATSASSLAVADLMEVQQGGVSKQATIGLLAAPLLQPVITGAIENIVIGAVTPKAATVTTLGTTSDLTLNSPAAATNPTLTWKSSSGNQYTAQRNGGTGIFEFSGTQAGFSGYNFNINSGGVTALAIVPVASATRGFTLTPSNGGNPTIGTSAGALAFSTGIDVNSNLANDIYLFGNSAGNSPGIIFEGSDAAVQATYFSKGTNGHSFYTGAAGGGSTAGAVAQAVVSHTASANRFLTLTGSNSGNPTIGTSGGDLVLSPNGGNAYISSSQSTLLIKNTSASANQTIWGVGSGGVGFPDFAIFAFNDAVSTGTAASKITRGTTTNVASHTLYTSTIAGTPVANFVLNTTTLALGATINLDMSSAGGSSAIYMNSRAAGGVHGQMLWDNGTSQNFSLAETAASMFAVGTALQGATTTPHFSFDLSTGTSPVNYLQVKAANTGGAALLKAVGESGASMGLQLPDTGSFSFLTGGGSYEQVRINNTTSAVNRINLTGAVTTSAPTISVAGTDTNIGLVLASKGTAGHEFWTGGGKQVQVNDTASANRVITLTGSNGGNPAIGVSGGNLQVSPNLDGGAYIRANYTTAIPAGGTAGTGLLVSSTANFGIFFGSGAPTLSAAKGSLYLRSDGSTTNDRMYVNTNGSTTWTAVTTAA